MEIAIKGKPEEIAALLLDLGTRRIDIKEIKENVCEEMAESVNRIWENQPKDV